MACREESTVPIQKPQVWDFLRHDAKGEDAIFMIVKNTAPQDSQIAELFDLKYNFNSANGEVAILLHTPRFSITLVTIPN